MIDITPSPIAIQIGPLPVYWYGIGYALGLAAAAWLLDREAKRRGMDASLIPNGLIVIAVAALIGGRLYHVIDQWALYKDDPIRIFLPPYSGLGVYGGIATGTVAAYLYIKRYGQSFWAWADVIAPALFVMQAIARWGNFFNQELYGGPTTLPWGIAIQCMNRIPAYACPPGSDPTSIGTEHFHPLFLYESISGVLGALALLWLGRRFALRLRRGDLLLIFFMWYGTVRFGLEFFRADNWTFFGIPMAQIVSAVAVLGALVVFFARRRFWPAEPMTPEPLESVDGTTPSTGPDQGPRDVNAEGASAGP